MSEVDSNATATAEAAAPAVKLSFLEMVQTAVNGVTDEDIAKRWPTNPVVDGGTVLGVASRDFVNAGGSRMTTSYFSPACASFGSSSKTFA